LPARPLEDREAFSAGVLKNSKEPDIAQAFVARLSVSEQTATVGRPTITRWQ